MDGAETQIRRPQAGRPGRRAFVSGKRRRNTLKTTTFSDGRGRLLLSGAVRPGRMHDRTALRTEGVTEQFRTRPPVEARVDSGYQGGWLRSSPTRSAHRRRSSRTRRATATRTPGRRPGAATPRPVSASSTPTPSAVFSGGAHVARGEWRPLCTAQCGAIAISCAAPVALLPPRVSGVGHRTDARGTPAPAWRETA
ncbi:transposase family protein [Streptomyces sp. GD-15H]|uniref:transposase family protein n=1 Tax=Streptomyces sp. GD-15H TaxID=3129112 RepID=UPI0038739387